jgi:ATP/maltotriose-dependent transcriptional regulator MalT
MDEVATTTLAADDHMIDRPRLTFVLTDSGARIILLAAPAGYGERKLAQQRSALQTSPVVWYRTTHGSGDVAALAVGLGKCWRRRTRGEARRARTCAPAILAGERHRTSGCHARGPRRAVRGRRLP